MLKLDSYDTNERKHANLVDFTYASAAFKTQLDRA